MIETVPIPNRLDTFLGKHLEIVIWDVIPGASGPYASDAYVGAGSRCKQTWVFQNDLYMFLVKHLQIFNWMSFLKQVNHT